MNQPNLEFLQGLTEAELSELVLIPLFRQMKYSDIRYTHGTLEYGKDILFCTSSPLEGTVHYCATVKRYPLSGSVSSSKSIHEVFFQVSQALTEPFIDPLDGRAVHIEKVFVITPFSVSQACARSISGKLQQMKKHITFIDGPKLLSLLREHLPELLETLPDPESRYAYTLFQRFSESTNLTTLGSQPGLSMLDIYTGGSVSPTSLEEAKYISFAIPSTSNSQITPQEMIQKDRFCVVLADVGTGKTTFVQKLVLDLSGLTSSKCTATSAVPVFVPLSILSEEDTRSYKLFSKAIESYLNEQHGLSTFSFRESERFLIFLDGFDEIPYGHKQVSSYIQTMSSAFQSGIVVTSRPSRPPALKSPFSYFKLNPFTDEEIEIFLKKWFLEPTKLHDDIYNKILSNDVLNRFCRTPLILTLYAILATRTSVDDLPTRKTDIYSAIVSLLLGQWDKIRSVKNNFSNELKQHVLELLAYMNHNNHTREFKKSNFLSLIQKALDSRHIEAFPETVFNEIFFRSSLIRPTAVGELYEFVHLSFQEFLCAQRLVRLSEASHIQKALVDEWWHNTLKFYFGIKRTLNGLRPSHAAKRSPDAGLRFVDFLSEADFTGEQQRQMVLNLLARDLLGGKTVNNRDLEVCIGIGDDVVYALSTRVNSLNFQGNVRNYFRLLALLRTRASKKALFDSMNHLAVLPALDLISLLTTCIDFLSEKASAKWFLEGLRSLRDVIKTRDIYSKKNGDIIHLELGLLSTKIQDKIKRHAVERREEDRILNTLKRVEMNFRRHEKNM